jgi:hypothetical protein
MAEGLLTRLSWGRRNAEKLRAAWTHDVRAEGDRVRRELKGLSDELGRMRGEQERLVRKLSTLQESFTEAFARQQKSERRAAQFILTFQLNDKQRDLVERLPALLDDARVSAHVRQAIASTALLDDPFPHMVVDDIVPRDLYKMMLRAIPPVEFFGDKDFTKQNLRIPVDGCPELTTRVWHFVGDMARQVVVPAVVARFAEPLQRHYETVFGEAFVERAAALPQAPSGGRVMLRRPGYHLSPHRDPKRAMLTCLMYLAAPGAEESYGTKIFRVTGDHESSYAQTYYPEQAGASCELVKTVPFRPNSMLVFLNGTGAHGADIPADAPADLERYSYQFYVGPSQEALDALVAELPEERRRMWQAKTGD